MKCNNIINFLCFTCNLSFCKICATKYHNLHSLLPLNLDNSQLNHLYLIKSSNELHNDKLAQLKIFSKEKIRSDSIKKSREIKNLIKYLKEKVKNIDFDLREERALVDSYAKDEIERCRMKLSANLKQMFKGMI